MASQTPSGASQRLLTMKFMQRAAAAASPTSPNTPSSDDGHNSKRRKTGGRSSLGGDPETPRYIVDQKATQAALDEEERRRQALIEKQAEQLGDGHWVLDASRLPKPKFEGCKVVQVGFSQIDAGNDSEDEKTPLPRADGPRFQSYGPKKATVSKTPEESDTNSDSDSDSDSNSDDSDSDSSSEESDADNSKPTPGRASYGSQKRNELRSKRQAEQEKVRKLAAERRQKKVQLNKLTSISGASSFNSKGSQGPSKAPPPRRR